MQTNENVLSKLAEDLKLRDIAHITQKHYLRMAQAFLEWSNISTAEIKEEDIWDYLVYLKNTRKLNSSTIMVRSTAIRLLFGTITGDKMFCPLPRIKPIKNGYLKNDKKAFIRYLVDMNYAERNLRNYKWAVNCLERFMHKHKQLKYSRAVGEAFIAESAKLELHTPGVLEMMGYVVRRFTCFKEGGEYILLMPHTNKDSPPQFAEELAKYLEFLKRKGLRKSTIEWHRYNIHKALLKFDASGIRGFYDIKPEAIYDAFERTSDKHSFCSTIRSLLRYLFKEELVDFDYAVFVPSVRRSRPVPSVYTKTETQKLLNTGESDSNSNNRNNEIILLALKLGIRSGDITNLKLDDVDWVNKEIRFIQEKTKIPQRLELLPEVEDALLTYISMARPTSDVPYVFSDDEIEKIIAVADNFAVGKQITRSAKIFTILLRVLYGCGLRSGEGRSLRWKDVDFENKVLTIRKAKNLKQRFVPMSDSMATLLKNYHEMTSYDGICSDYLFESNFNPGNYFRNNSFSEWFRKALDAAEINYAKHHNKERGPCPHCLRHTFVLKSFLKSQDEGRRFEDTVPFLAAYLGHDSTNETEAYLRSNHIVYTQSHKRVDKAIGYLFPEVSFDED